MIATTQIDIFDVAGTWRDSCEYWQLDKLLPIFTVLFGTVTWRPRSTVTQPAVDFWEWLETI